MSKKFSIINFNLVVCSFLIYGIYSVTNMVNMWANTYPIEQIESIDGKRLILSDVIENKELLSTKDILSKQDEDWYINNDFSFKIRKIPGWEISYEKKGVIKDVPTLGLNFTRPGWKKNTTGPLMIIIKKFKRLYSTGINDLMKGERFIIYADSVIDSSTKNFKKSFLDRKTVSINNLTVRQAKWEWFDKEHGNNRISILMIFEPIEIGSDFIDMQVIFTDNSEDYAAYSSELEKSLHSISVNK